ncbi:MAG: RNA methyltransferase [Dehalococcoidia bacterium]
MSPKSSFPLKPLRCYKELSARKGRDESGAFLIEGERAVRQIAQSSPESIIEILAREKVPPAFGEYQTRILTDKQFRTITNTETPQGIIAVVNLPTATYAENLPADAGGRILLLEDVQDPGNVGTLIRTAAAFGFDGIIMSQRCADPFSPKCVQASAGAVLSLWIRRSAAYLDLAQKLKGKGLALAVADVRGAGAPELLRSQDRLVIALGNEAAGPSRDLLELADYRVKIPVAGAKAESLNVAACGAILMYLGSVHKG